MRSSDIEDYLSDEEYSSDEEQTRTLSPEEIELHIHSSINSAYSEICYFLESNFGFNLHWDCLGNLQLLIDSKTFNPNAESKLQSKLLDINYDYFIVCSLDSTITLLDEIYSILERHFNYFSVDYYTFSNFMIDYLYF